MLHLPAAGKAEVQVSFLIPLKGNATARSLTFGIPAALTSEVKATLPKPMRRLASPVPSLPRPKPTPTKPPSPPYWAQPHNWPCNGNRG